MFDNLKDKLGSFREDVEETAEEKAAEAEAEADAEAEPAGAASEDTGAVDAEAAEEPASASDAEAEAAPDAETEAEPTPEPESESESELDSEADADSEAGAESEADAGAGTAEESDRGFGQRARLFVTGQAVIEEEDLEGPLQDLEMALLASDVEMSVAQEILENLREELLGTTREQVETTGQVVEAALTDALVDVISVGQFDFDGRIAEAEKPVVIVFTGVNGVGKTTTIAKMARRLEAQGYSSVLANGDTYRAGANEQIREHAEALDKRLIAHEQGGDPAAVIYDAVEYAEANDVDVVLGDTAGRLHTSNDLMAQLEKIDRVVDPDMTLFVDEAVAGQDAVNRAREFDEAAAIDGAVLTKADADSQGGAAISIARVTGKPILFLGTGQGYDDLEPFDPEALVADLLDEE
jgi:fused signal recognition particle receptor